MINGRNRRERAVGFLNSVSSVGLCLIRLAVEKERLGSDDYHLLADPKEDRLVQASAEA